MYCRNCGSQMEDIAAVCVKCGVKKGMGVSFCPNCGSHTDPGAVYCTNCGVDFKNASGEQKSKLVAGLLGIFVGGLGIHNFYLGFTKKAILQIALSFCFGIGAIWGFVEGILILIGKIDTDANGVPLKE